MGKSFAPAAPLVPAPLPLMPPPIRSGGSGGPDQHPWDQSYSRDEPAGIVPAMRRAVKHASGGDSTSYVIGPVGERLTKEELPSGTKLRWVARRKAQVVAAVEGGLLTAAEACTRYNLSPEELTSWRQIYGEEGLQGLRLRQIDAHRLDRKRKRKKH